MIGVAEKPEILKVFPTYGPVAGQTNITITGQGLVYSPPEKISVIIGAQDCSVLSV